jgi:hypothetical protein
LLFVIPFIGFFILSIRSLIAISLRLPLYSNSVFRRAHSASVLSADLGILRNHMSVGMSTRNIGSDVRFSRRCGEIVSFGFLHFVSLTGFTRPFFTVWQILYWVSFSRWLVSAFETLGQRWLGGDDSIHDSSWSWCLYRVWVRTFFVNVWWEIKMKLIRLYVNEN